MGGPYFPFDFNKLPKGFDPSDLDDLGDDESLIDHYYLKQMYGQLPLPVNDQEWMCQHEPIDVGFTHNKWVCRKCDKDLPDYKEPQLRDDEK